MSPEFTREQQQAWFDNLPGREDYLIWGLRVDGHSIGVFGLKHIENDEAEYWGYIGEKEYWGKKLGRQIMDAALEKARGLGVTRLYLRVHSENPRAIALYSRFGFVEYTRSDDVIFMERSV